MDGESENTFFILTGKDLSQLNKKDAPQDAQLAEKKVIAPQYCSRAEIAKIRNLFYMHFRINAKANGTANINSRKRIK